MRSPSQGNYGKQPPRTFSTQPSGALQLKPNHEEKQKLQQFRRIRSNRDRRIALPPPKRRHIDRKPRFKNCPAWSIRGHSQINPLDQNWASRLVNAKNSQLLRELKSTFSNLRQQELHINSTVNFSGMQLDSNPEWICFGNRFGVRFSREPPTYTEGGSEGELLIGQTEANDNRVIGMESSGEIFVRELSPKDVAGFCSPR